MILGVDFNGENGIYYFDIYSIKSEDSRVYHQKAGNFFNYEESIDWLYNYILIKKPEELVIDMMGIGLLLKEKMLNKIKHSDELQINENGKLFYRK